jgi:DNA replication protein DnaC
LMTDSIPKCQICGKEYIESTYTVRDSNYYNTVKYRLFPTCDCGRKREEQKEKGQARAKYIIKFKQIVGERFYNKTFSNFKKADNPKAYSECLGYVRNLEENLKQGKGLCLTGNVGSGKTHLISAMIDWIARIAKRKKFDKKIIFKTSVDLITTIKYSFDNTVRDKTLDDWDLNTERLMELFETCNLLIIDDLGTEKTTDWSSELLYKIIDTRYSNLKATIITTNLSTQELKDKLSERLMSRIYEMCKGVKVLGKDHRLEIKGGKV